MARIRKRKYKKEILDVEVVEEKINIEKIVSEKITIFGKRVNQLVNQLDDWLKQNKKTIILSSYIFFPLLVIWVILKESIPNDFPVVQLKYLLFAFSFFPIMTHYVYLTLEVRDGSFKNFGNNIKVYVKKMPFDLILLVCGLVYLTIPSNEYLNSFVLFILISYIAYKISKFILYLNISIKSLIAENDTDKFKMYMQLINKILLAIITLIGSILTILLTIKQLLS